MAKYLLTIMASCLLGHQTHSKGVRGGFTEHKVKVAQIFELWNVNYVPWGHDKMYALGALTQFNQFYIKERLMAVNYMWAT
jgi:hypothetical protein